MSVIDTPRLTLRRPEAGDFAAYRAYYTGPRTAHVGGPLSDGRVFERFCSMIGHWDMRGFGRFTILRRADGAPLGHAGPMQLTEGEPAEMTWTLWDAAHEGRGYATEAATAVLDRLWSAGWAALIARVEAGNAPSRRLAERIGGVIDPGAPAPELMPGAVTYRFAAPLPQGDVA